MNAQLIAALFAIALAIIGLGSAVVVGLRGAALKADLDRVRQSNEDLRHEIEDKDRHTEEQDAKIEDLERDLREVKADNVRKNAALARIGEAAASAGELREIAGVLRDHDREAAARHSAIIKVLRDIRKAMSERDTEEES